MIFSALFSGAETAFLSISQINRSELDPDDKKKLYRLTRLNDRIQEILIALLIGNTIANLAAATIAALVAASFAQAWSLNETLVLAIEVITVTMVLLILSELFPKLIAVRNPLHFASALSGFISAYINLIRPLTYILDMFTRLIQKIPGIGTSSIPFRKEELLTLVEVGEEKGTLEKEEREMISSIFEFRDTQVREIMVPRIDIVAVEQNTTLEELIELIKKKGHTRIPIYDTSIDKVLGILHAKDLLPFLHRKNEKIDFTQLARPLIYVPEYKMIDDLLRDFQSEQLHMAIVVDEYGGTAGLVTLEDVLEEIVGEIQDEYDHEPPLLRKIDANTVVVNAKIDLHDLNRELELELPTDEGFESLGGFIFSLTGSVPIENEVIEYKNCKFIVESINRNRIGLIRIQFEQKQSDTA
ncbi:MAG: HlyC/CorC family transporter [Deferribacteres bacterium]|nr:HlyC/CorC family transporter [candidate division KSB1 bacterium]MCB9502998.1 HlyC/CorC family transporter [Deferribacteres bacterium]